MSGIETKLSSPFFAVESLLVLESCEDGIVAASVTTNNQANQTHSIILREYVMVTTHYELLVYKPVNCVWLRTELPYL